VNARRTLATTARVLTQIRHDPRTIALLVVVPCFLIGLVAWIFSNGRAFQTIGPAMIAVFPFIVMFTVTSVITLRERRSGTLERLLALPLAKADFIVGYALAFALLAAIQVTAAVSFAVWVCGLTISGDVLLFFAAALTDAVLGTSLGLLVSAFATSEFQAVQFLPALVFPQILLGGLFLPRAQLPDVLHAVGDWLPLTHTMDAISAVAADSHGTGWVLDELAVAAAYAVGALLLGALTLRRRTP